MPTLYKRKAGFSSNDEHLTSNELYGKLKVSASKSCPTLILTLYILNELYKLNMRITFRLGETENQEYQERISNEYTFHFERFDTFL